MILWKKKFLGDNGKKQKQEADILDVRLLVLHKLNTHQVKFWYNFFP